MSDETLAAETLRREQRRIRLIAAATIGLWVLAALVAPGFYLPYQALVEPKVAFLEELADRQDPSVTPYVLAGHIAVTTRAAAVAAVGVLVAFTLTSLLAAVCTTWLVFSVRRLTVRQLTDGLADISRQLRRMEEGGR